MCVRQMHPIHFAAIFHWLYLTRTMLFSCRYVLTGVWHKHLSIYIEWRKNLTLLCTHVNSSIKRRWRHLPTYFSTIRTETICSDDQGYQFGVWTNTVSMSSRRPPIPPPPAPAPPLPTCTAQTLLGSTPGTSQKTKDTFCITKATL